MESATRLLEADEEARLFWRLRARMVARQMAHAMRHARLRMSLVLLISGLLWLGLFWLFTEGFLFLRSSIVDTSTYSMAVEAIYSVFFASLMVMLVFSAGIILYSSLFRSSEARFLLTTPTRRERIFLVKLQESLFFASWAFLLLGTPMLVAYGAVSDAPWYYFALLVPFMLAFTYIPGALGAILCLVVVHQIPTVRRHALAVCGVCLVLGGAWLARSFVAGWEGSLPTPRWFHESLERLQFSEYRLLPSWWLTAGLLAAAIRDWPEALLFFSLTFANALVCHETCHWTARRLFHAGYNRLYSLPSVRRRVRAAWLDHVIGKATFFLSVPMRLLLIKDLRVFRRDPVQWSQFLIFFGLLGLYFVNIRRLSYDLKYAAWVNMISFLNLGVVGLILSTFTTRFIFPMISLEGRRFWILGLMPIRRETILWSKFLFAAAGSILPCSLLVTISDVMLGVPVWILAIHLLVCLQLCVGLAAIAVGLGARLPNLRETSPSRIAAGFGGTLNLIVSAVYIATVVLLLAVPCHFLVAASQLTFARGVSLDHIRGWMFGGGAASVAVAIVATVIPLRMGFRAFRQLDL